MFQKLLGMVPHLGERFMACSNEESMTIADLVSLLHTYCMLVFNSVSGSERRLEYQVGRHEECERRRVRLDNSPRRPAEPASLTQCQDEARLPSQRYWRTSLSRWRGLE
jgi:hypothetical protein